MRNWVVCSVFILVCAVDSHAEALESPQSIGWFCSPTTTSITEGQYYIPGSGICSYLSPTITGLRYGDLYRGVVGSSTIVNGHFLGSQSFSTQSGDAISNPVQNENFFAAIYPAHLVSEFRNYFQFGVGEIATSTTNFGFIRFMYGEVDSEEPEIIDPVIVIPGILGSEKNSDGEWVIDPILHTYDDLIATLDVNYYTPGVNLFPFPYNWRKSNVETAVLLKQKIDEVKEICSCDKVDLVAHSMGGLVARQYIQSDAYERDVDQLIFLGTPHLGAPKAYLMWEGGEYSPLALRPEYIVDSVIELILSLEAYELGYDNLFDYLQGVPISSVRQLLPIYSYIFDEENLRLYPNNYPVNEFLVDLEQDRTILEESGVRISNFVGDRGLNTISGVDSSDSSGYLPKWVHGLPKLFYAPLGNHGLRLSTGDGTVPLSSASHINAGLQTFSLNHRELVTGSQERVFKELTGAHVSTLITDRSGVLKNIIVFRIFSPADLLIIAPNGKKIGKENGQSINQIPGAFYTGFNVDAEFITILNPLDGEYKIITQGTGSGSYTVETDYISDATTTSAAYTGATSPGMVTQLKLHVDTAHPGNLNIKTPDANPPVITIAQPLAKDYTRSEQLPVSVSAQDESGVTMLVTKMGTTTIPNIGTIDLFFQKLGPYTVTTFSSDAHGNATTSSRAFRVIANATSTIADFERVYGLGWMTKKAHDDLAKKIKAIVVLKKTIKNITETTVETGRNGKKMTKNVQKKVEIVEQVLDKVAAKAILKELDKYRGKGLDEKAYQILKEDLQWLINN